jgi:hypothetical protein
LKKKVGKENFPAFLSPESVAKVTYLIYTLFTLRFRQKPSETQRSGLARTRAVVE